MKRHSICIRTKKAREDAGIKAADLAENLGISYDAYNKYETRSPLRQDLISPFCVMTGVNERWLLTGEEDSASETSKDDIHTLFERIENTYKDDEFISPLLKSLKAATVAKDKK